MSATEMLKEKYSDYVIECVRQRLRLEKDDTSDDQFILDMDSNKVFKHVVGWNGLMGSYDSTIKDWVLDIYGVDLDNIKNK